MDTILQTFKDLNNNFENFQNNFNEDFSNLESQLYALQEEEKYAATMQEEKKLKERWNNLNVNLNYLEAPNCELQDEEQAARSIPNAEIIKSELNIPGDDTYRDRGYHQAVYVGNFVDITQVSRGLWIFYPGIRTHYLSPSQIPLSHVPRNPIRHQKLISPFSELSLQLSFPPFTLKIYFPFPSYLSVVPSNKHSLTVRNHSTTLQCKSTSTVKFVSGDINNDRSFKRVFEKFNKSSKHESCLYKTVIHRLASAKCFNWIEEILEDQKKHMDISIAGFSVRLDEMPRKSGMFEHAQKVFDEMPDRNCKRTILSLDALLRRCVNSSRFDLVDGIFRELPNKFFAHRVLKVWPLMGVLEPFDRGRGRLAIVVTVSHGIAWRLGTGIGDLFLHKNEAHSKVLKLTIVEKKNLKDWDANIGKVRNKLRKNLMVMGSRVLVDKKFTPQLFDKLLHRAVLEWSGIIGTVVQRISLRNTCSPSLSTICLLDLLSGIMPSHWPFDRGRERNHVGMHIDGRVLLGRSVVNESMITGESLPLCNGKGLISCDEVPLSEFA